MENLDVPKTRKRLVRMVGSLYLLGSWILCAQVDRNAPLPGPIFEKLQVESKMKPSERELILEYQYRNTVDYPLAVERFEESCGCMAGDWDGVAVEPGKTGVIRARFAPNGARGTLRKSLVVHFVGGDRVELVGVVEVPEVVAYSQRSLRWQQGGSTARQVVDIQINSAKPVRVLEALGSDDAAWQVRLSEITAGQHYRLTVMPLDTQEERMAVVQIRTDSKDPRDALSAVFVQVESSNKTGTSK